MKFLFSDKYLLPKLGVVIVLLLGLCVSTHIAGNKVEFDRYTVLKNCIQNPYLCTGKPLVMRVKLKQSSDGSFIGYPRIGGVYQLTYPVTLVGNLIGFQHGYVIDILGSYSPDTRFIVTKYQRGNWVRVIKYAVSFLGLLLTVILFFRRYRTSSSRLLPLVPR